MLLVCHIAGSWYRVTCRAAFVLHTGLLLPAQGHRCVYLEPCTGRWIWGNATDHAVGHVLLAIGAASEVTAGPQYPPINISCCGVHIV